MGLVVAAVSAACGAAGGAGGSAAEEPLRVVGPFELHGIDPATSGGFFTQMQVAETLVDADTEGALRPGLATEWAVSDDQLSWRFTLRPGAVFHDGTDVTAEAAAASLELARAQEGTPLATAPVTSVAADGEQVVIRLEEPFGPLPAVLAHTGAQILAPSSYDPDGSVTQVVGTGPYRVERIEQPARIDVVAFDQWQGDQPAVERVSYQAVGRAETRAVMAESGQADITYGMDPVALQRVESSQDVKVESVTLPRTIQLKVNADHEILGDPRVRRALSLALDRESMATALLRDPEMAATQLFPPSLPEWHSSGVAPLEHDREEARALLAQAGWTANGDGVLTRDGEPFEIGLRTFPDRPELPPIATAIQSALEDVGISLDVQVGNSSEIAAGHQDGSLELGLYARNFALVPDPLVTLLEDFGPQGADWGAMGWTDPDLDTLLGRLAEVAEPADEAQGRAEVAEILQEELPVIPVAWYRQSAVVSDRVEGFVLDPLERSWLLADLDLRSE